MKNLLIAEGLRGPGATEGSLGPSVGGVGGTGGAGGVTGGGGGVGVLVSTKASGVHTAHMPFSSSKCLQHRGTLPHRGQRREPFCFFECLESEPRDHRIFRYGELVASIKDDVVGKRRRETILCADPQPATSRAFVPHANGKLEGRYIYVRAICAWKRHARVRTGVRCDSTQCRAGVR